MRAAVAMASSHCDKGDDVERPTPTSTRSESPWRHVATAFVSVDDISSSSSSSTNSPPRLRYAFVRRSDLVSTYRGKWGAVSGGIEAGVDASAAERAATEVEEEVGLDRKLLKVECCGRPLEVDDGPRRRFVVHPVRFRYRVDGDDGGDDGRGKPSSASASHSPLPRLTTNWESTEAAWLSEEEISQRETVPRLLDALRRTMAPPPSLPSSPPPRRRRRRFSLADAAVSEAVSELVDDRAHGASQLARVALRGLRDAAAAAAAEAAAEGGNSGGGGGGGDNDNDDGASEEEAAAAAAAAAWELCADWGFALAASRPTMAPLSTSVASALVRAAGGEKGAAAEAAASAASPPAVFAAVAQAAAEEEARLADASKELVSAGVEALRGALSRWRLRQRRQEEEEQERQMRQQQGHSHRREAREARNAKEGEPAAPRIVTISFSSVVRDALVALIKEVTAERQKEREQKGKALSSSSSSPPSPSPLSSSPPLLRICVCEGRPLREGARLAEELAEEAAAVAAGFGAPPLVEVELCTDAAGPALVREEGSGSLPAAAAVVLGADAVYPEASSPSSSVFSGGVVNKVGSRALVEAAASLEGSVPAFALAGRAKVGGAAAGGVAALAAASGSGLLRTPRSLEENSGDELLTEDEVVKAKKGSGGGSSGGSSGSGVVTLRNPYFESVPLRLFEASGGGIVVEAAGGKGDGNDGGVGRGRGDDATSPPSSPLTLLTARDVADLAERADERARAAFRMDWL